MNHRRSLVLLGASLCIVIAVMGTSLMMPAPQSTSRFVSSGPVSAINAELEGVVFLARMIIFIACGSTIAVILSLYLYELPVYLRKLRRDRHADYRVNDS